MQKRQGTVDVAALAAQRVPPGVAKYEHLRARMAAAIDAGTWEAGRQLPPELDIAASTRLSLGTVQRALRELVAQGYVVRRQGSGTFVADRARAMDAPLHCRFAEPGGETVLPVYTRLVGRRLVRDPDPWSAVLGPDPAGAVLLDRSLDIGGRFPVASRMYLHASRFGTLLDLPEAAFTGVNLKKLLIGTYGVSVRSVEQRIRLEPPTAEVREWLGGEPGPLVMAIRAIGFGSDRHPVYYQLLWVPPCDEELVVESLVE